MDPASQTTENAPATIASHGGTENENAVPAAPTAEHGLSAAADNPSNATVPVPPVGSKLEDTAGVFTPSAKSREYQLMNMITGARKSPSQVASPVKIRREVIDVPLFKTPPKARFWRSRPDVEPICYELLKCRRDGKMDEEFYLIPDPELLEELKADLYVGGQLATFRLTLIVDPKGAYGFCCVPWTSDNEWHESARDNLAKLETSWGRIEGGEKGYNALIAIDDLGNPQWPAEDDNVLLLKAFRNRMITSHDHPVLKYLRGIAQ